MHTVTRDDDRTVIDGERQWAIYQCGHGSLHLSLDRLMLTLTDDEFHALQDLMRRACERFHGDDGLRGPSLRRH